MAIIVNIMIFASPKIIIAQDCGDCSSTTWSSELSSTFNIQDCSFMINFDYRECEDSTETYRELRISSIEKLNPECDTISSANIYHQSLKYLLYSYFSVFSPTNYYDTTKISFVTPPCLKEADMEGVIEFCSSTYCDKVEYNLTGHGQFTTLVGSHTFTPNYMDPQPCGTVSPCGTPMQFVYNIPPGPLHNQLFTNPTSGEDCDNVCFWKLDGNENVDDVYNFLGPINWQDLIFKTHNTERMRVTKYGTVGIKTKHPLGLFDVNFATWGPLDPIYNEASYPRIVHQSNSNIPSLNLITATGGADCGTNSNKEIYHWQIEGETGNWNPNDITKVVYGALNFNAKQYCLDISEGLQNDVLETKVSFTRNGKVGIMTNTPMDNLHIIGNMRINAEGDENALEASALTGTHSDYLLAVEGKIVAKEIIVTETNWADHVFLPNYKLTPLSELEVKIKELGHLPGIPSEAKVLENGYSVNDMQVKMLEKIEELTLYMIELKKENEKLQAEVNKLKGE